VELVVNIFSYLPLNTLMIAYTVSQRWYKVITTTNRFWKAQYLNLYKIPIPDQYQYENEFRRKFTLLKNWRFGRFQKLSFEAHQQNIYCVDFTNDFIYTGSRDMTIKVWDMKTMMVTKTLVGHVGAVLSLRQTEKYVVSGSADHSIIVWDLFTGGIEMQLRGHLDSVLSVAVENDVIVSGSKDNSIKMWDIKQQRLLYTLWGHEASVNGVAFKNGIICSGSAGF
jgi:F-box and WD-40 domain protein 1/11